MVSLRDIARELDISVGLVSKVLNGRMGTTGVSAAKRQLILKKAQELGFVPNRTAVALRSGQIGAVGVLVHPWGESGTEISSQFIKGVSIALSSNYFNLWLSFFEFEKDFRRQIRAEDLRHQADALIVAGIPHPELIPVLEQLEKAGVPVIVAEEDHFAPSLTNIFVDVHQQGFLPTMHLIERGARRIAHIIGGSESRRQGYLDALRAASRQIDPRLVIVEENYKVESGRRAVARLLDSQTSFDGIVAQSDHQALGALYELQSRGIRVPDQVKLIGVDDSPICEISPLLLSSVTSEAQQIGEAATQSALKRINGQSVPSAKITPRVIARATS